MVKPRLLTPRELATRLRERAKLEPDSVSEYLETHTTEWEALAAADPHDAADILEELGEGAAIELVNDLSASEAAEVLGELRPNLAANILDELLIVKSAEVLAAMQPDDAADVIGLLNPELRARLFATMPDSAETEVLSLLAYPADSAGGLMTRDIAALPDDIAAGEAIEALRTLHEHVEDLSYVYIVDVANRLRGVMSFRDLVFNASEVKITDIMVSNPIHVGVLADREEVSGLTQRYNLFGLPVTDGDGQLLGMVTTEAVLEAVHAEASEDFATAVGAGAEETAYSPVLTSVRNRVPWLSLNLFLALGTLLAVRNFTDLLTQAPILAAIMPLVATLGGNAGAQSLAVLIRELARDDVPRSEVPGIIRRQLAIGAASGVVVGFLAFATVSLLPLGGATPQVAAVVGLGAFVNLIIATSAGSMIPLGFRAVGLDPALASNIFVTLLTDLSGFGGFLGLASILL
jgi:magnesium transporter